MSISERPIRQQHGSLEYEHGRVYLQVGTRFFNTTRSTLIGESGYFRAILLNQRQLMRQEETVFVDGNPDLFEIVLQYLRISTPPIFFDSVSQTHDLARYSALLGEAKFYQIPRLIWWIENRKFQDVVNVRLSSEVRSMIGLSTLSWSSSLMSAKVSIRPFLAPVEEEEKPEREKLPDKIEEGSQEVMKSGSQEIMQSENEEREPEKSDTVRKFESKFLVTKEEVKFYPSQLHR